MKLLLASQSSRATDLRTLAGMSGLAQSMASLRKSTRCSTKTKKPMRCDVSLNWKASRKEEVKARMSRLVTTPR